VAHEQAALLLAQCVAQPSVVQHQPALFQCTSHDVDETVRGKRLFNEVVGSFPDRLDGERNVRITL
jgi:hypothetical protein